MNKTCSILTRSSILVEFIFFLTFTYDLACMDRLSKLNSPFFLTFAYDLGCMDRNDEPCRQACKLHLLRKHNLARCRGIRRIHPRT